MRAVGPVPGLGALGLLGALCLPPQGLAQGCAGAPLETRSWDLGVLAAAAREPLDDGTDGIELGASVATRPFPRLRAEAAVTRRELSGSAVDPFVGRARVHLSLERAPLLSRLPFVPCLTAGAGVALARRGSSDADYTSAAFPVGLSLGRSIEVGGGVRLTPYVAPQLLYGLVDGRVLRVPVSESDLAAGLELGAGTRVGDLSAEVSLFLSGLGPELGTGPWPERLVAVRLGLLL